MVDKNPEGSCKRINKRLAVFSPPSAFFSNCVLFNDKTAISVAAKNAFNKIKIICNNNCEGIESITSLSFYFLALYVCDIKKDNYHNTAIKVSLFHI